MKGSDFQYIDVLQGVLIEAWFGVSKLCSTTTLRKAIQWQMASLFIDVYVLSLCLCHCINLF